MHRQVVRLGHIPYFLHHFHRHDLAAGQRIFQTDQRRGRLVNVIGTDGCLDHLGIGHGTGEGHLPHIDTGQHCHSTYFVQENMALGAHDDLVATAGLGHDAQLIAHGAAGDEHRSLFAQNAGSLGLQLIGGGIVLIYVITHSRPIHGLAHGLRRLCHRVASQINITFFFHSGSLRILFCIPAAGRSFSRRIFHIFIITRPFPIDNRPQKSI